VGGDELEPALRLADDPVVGPVAALAPVTDHYVPEDGESAEWPEGPAGLGTLDLGVKKRGEVAPGVVASTNCDQDVPLLVQGRSVRC
jgi:hypothetical protein